MSDVGINTTMRLIDRLREIVDDESLTEPDRVRVRMRSEIAEMLTDSSNVDPFPPDKPVALVVVGVNGAGKTTSIAKLVQVATDEGQNVMLAAADTFRAAAVEQLKIWGERTGCPVVARDGEGGDPAGLAYDALARARDEGVDVLLIDTAGRLQNKANLMAELQKIDRVVKKLDAEAPHTRLLVLDATTGQNAHSQVEIFREAVDIDSLIVTKLDGTAKGGVLVALARRFGLPVYALGVGEAVEDLRPFNAREFARALMNLET